LVIATGFEDFERACGSKKKKKKKKFYRSQKKKNAGTRADASAIGGLP